MKNFLKITTFLAALFFFAPITSASATTCSGGTPANTCYWIGGTGTWDNSSTTHWSFTTGGTTCSCLPSSATDKIVLDGSSGGGTVTASATISGSTFASITMGAFTGTLDFSANNPSITLSTAGAAAFSVTGTGTRNLNLGTGTFTLISSNAAGWDCTTSTNMTASLASATLLLAPNNYFGSMNFVTGGAACGGSNYGTVNVAPTLGSEQVSISGSGATFAHFGITGPARVSIPNLTVTNAIAWAGTAANLIQLSGSTVGTVSTITLSAAGNTASWTAFAGITAATNSITASNSFNMGSNTNISVTNPNIVAGGSRCIGC